jgi:hypothetical protein
MRRSLICWRCQPVPRMEVVSIGYSDSDCPLPSIEGLRQRLFAAKPHLTKSRASQMDDINVFISCSGLPM